MEWGREDPLSSCLFGRLQPSWAINGLVAEPFLSAPLIFTCVEVFLCAPDKQEGKGIDACPAASSKRLLCRA